MRKNQCINYIFCKAVLVQAQTGTDYLFLQKPQLNSINLHTLYYKIAGSIVFPLDVPRIQFVLLMSKRVCTIHYNKVKFPLSWFQNLICVFRSQRAHLAVVLTYIEFIDPVTDENSSFKALPMDIKYDIVWLQAL